MGDEIRATGPAQRITGTTASTPAVPAADPASDSFLIIPDNEALHPGYPAPINQLLITGCGISRSALSTLLPPGATTSFRSDTLASLSKGAKLVRSYAEAGDALAIFRRRNHQLSKQCVTSDTNRE